jgi:GT2 family glycosyltransferase
MTVDVILLSFCKDDEHYALNKNCIESLLSSETGIEFNIVILESNQNWAQANYVYPWPKVTVIVPLENFNFNRFLNIGIQQTSQELVVLANNDLVFHKNWLTEILKIRKINPAILSFCPFDRTSIYLSWNKFKKRQYIPGYRVPIELVGWCIVIDRTALAKIGNLDESFDLYFQDNDFANTLKQNKVPHALVPASFVEHLGGATTRIKDPSGTEKYAHDKEKFLKKWGHLENKGLKQKLATLFHSIKRKLQSLQV